MSFLERLACGARVPVYVLAGDGARAEARRLRLEPRLRLVASPRHATVLLVAGRLPAALIGPAKQAHDQLPAPRAVLVWSDDAGSISHFPGAARVRMAEDPTASLVALHHALVRGERESSPHFGPTKSPVEWRGIGPYGQGGEGMMGGKPYGRSLAMTSEDLRDGLALDSLQVSVGPLLPYLPPGFRLDVTLQGDVIQSLSLRVASFQRLDVPEVFVRARSGRVSLAELELARARHLLAATSDLLLLFGLDALSDKTLRMAARCTPGDATSVRRLLRALRHTGALRLGTKGVATLDKRDLGGLGPVTRASDGREDARQHDPAYAGVGFELLTREAGDANARWQQRLLEAAQALDLAARAGDRIREPGPVVEGPSGPLREERDGKWAQRIEHEAAGMSFESLITFLASLDLDPALLPPTLERESHDEDQVEDGHDSKGGDNHPGSQKDSMTSSLSKKEVA